MDRSKRIMVLVTIFGVGAAPYGANPTVERPELATQREPETHRIVAGPEIRVSRHAQSPHSEMLIATNPRDANNLVAASMTVHGPSGRFSLVVFASHDGGNTWTSYDPPRQQEIGGSDPLIAFGPTGTAHFLAYARGHDLYHSVDGGTTWTLTQRQAAHGDHLMMAVDLTSGSGRGNLYALANHGLMYRSTDDGRTLSDSFDVVRSPVENGGVMVLSDGSIVAAFGAAPLGDGRSGLATVISRDGGKTWSPPAPITTVHIPARYAWESMSPGVKPLPRGIRPSDLRLGMHAFAADTARNSRYRDRIYVAWSDVQKDGSRIRVSSSNDRGRTWTRGTAITPEGEGLQFLPTIATNKDGVLGVLYYDTRGFPKDGHFNAYFAASIDGGTSFLTPQRLTSRPSTMETPAHYRPLIGNVRTTVQGVTFGVWSLLNKFSTGGDYRGLAADVAGVFHPLWADSRSGVYQAYTSRVAVVSNSELARLGSGLSESIVLDTRVGLLVDPIAFDYPSLVATIPIRLRNVSSDTIFGPISVHVKAIKPSAWRADTVAYVKVLNAANGASATGAVFDYTPALGGFRYLAPGAVSSAID